MSLEKDSSAAEIRRGKNWIRRQCRESSLKKLLLAFAFTAAFVRAFTFGLPRDCGFKALLVLIDMREIALGIDERIRIVRTLLLKLRVLVGQVIERSVRADPHVGRKRSRLLVR